MERLVYQIQGSERDFDKDFEEKYIEKSIVLEGENI